MAMRVGPVAYGALFVLIIPALLVWWAVAAADAVTLPVVHWLWPGTGFAGIGLGLMLLGWHALWRHGDGLPMNAFPPRRLVTKGVYGLLRHPIYVGFAFLVGGVSLALGSASGLWLVTPTVMLAMAALVWGYERHDLERRFGEAALAAPRLALPPASAGSPSGWHRVSVFALVFFPWSAAYEAVFRLGVPPDAVLAPFAFERSWPVLEWTELVYASVYLFVMLAALVIPTQRGLRHFAVTGLVATFVVTLIYLTVPVVSPPRLFEPSSFFGEMLMFERAMSHTVAAFPAFHVVWTLIAAEGWSGLGRRAATLAWLWAVLISISCITTGMHAIIDVIFAVVVWSVVRKYDVMWDVTRRGAERIANSWREWRAGPVRLINHGFYAGAGAALGFWIMGGLAGREHLGGIAIVAVSSLVGAGLWAQQLEGSEKLSRPFGSYGSFLGSLVGAGISGLVYDNGLLMLAAIAAAGPWVQGIGRLRCLVQGCCHGSVAPPTVGIRYRMPRSRVCQLSDLADRPLHPTPVYSMMTNAVAAVLLLRLWYVGAPLGLIFGVSWLLNAISRFVEESYRGEPQTMIVGGLRIYQWAAMVCAVIGAVGTTLGTVPAPSPSFGPAPGLIGGALVFGLVVTFAMGVDFPGSTRRFARLAAP